MLIHYHAPYSRSSRILTLIEELGARDKVETRLVPIASRNEGKPDPANPHPEGKVPLLDHDGHIIRESIAIALHLANLFPEAGLAYTPTDPRQGEVLSWCTWYAGVLEPLIVLQEAKLGNDTTRLTWRDWDAAMAWLSAGLKDRPYLTGDRYTVADLIVASTFGWRKELLPDDPVVRDWAERCMSRPSVAKAIAADGEWMKAA